MTPVRNSTNLKDFCRTRQWQLKKQFVNINTRHNQMKRSSDHCPMIVDLNINSDNGEYLQNTFVREVRVQDESMREAEMQGRIDETMVEDEVQESIVEDENEEESELDIENEESESDIENEESETDVSQEENNHEDEFFDGQNRMWEDDSNEPLYEGATLSVAETMIAILTFVLKFNLTGTCLSALLKLISLIIPATPRFKKTVYKFHKFFNNIKSPLVRHYYCSLCYSQLFNDTDACDCAETAKISYFLEIPIISQLQSLFSRPNFVNDLHHRFSTEKVNSIADIYNGKIYKNYTDVNRLLADRNNLSFMFYTDGAPAFKSSKCKVWPIYLIINELPYNKRILKENIIVAGIWFGQENPKPNLFLQPLHSEMVKLRLGVHFRIPTFDIPQKVKALLLCGTCDIPAKADFVNHSHHNGFYGCTLCYSSGYNISGANFGNTHIYPFDGPLVPRTLDEHRQHAEEAYNQGQKVFGVKGPSILFSTMPNAINGMSIDIMHCVFSGVIPKLVFLWFDSSLRHEPFSLYAERAVVDDRLVKIQPISSVSRIPRSISDTFKHWKSSEWRNFFFYYSIPILQDIMAQKYLEHYMQLVMGIYILSSKNISPENLLQAEELLICFVSNFQALYDARFMSININLLMHLAESVRNTGPTWITTCFPYEDLNGKLLKYIHGTNHVGLQIGSSVAYSIIISNVVAELDENSKVKKFCLKLLMTGKRITKTQKIRAKTYIVGKMKNCQYLPQYLKDKLVESGFRISGLKVFSYRGIKKHGHIIYSCNYTRSKLYASCGVVYKVSSTEKKIGFIESFFRLCYCDNECQPDYCQAVFIAIIKDGITNTSFNTSSNMIINNIDSVRNYEHIPLSYLHSFNENGIKKLILVSNIESICFTIKVNEKIWIGELINDADFKGTD